MKILGLKEMKEQLREYAANMDNWRSTLKKIGKFELREVDANFAKQGAFYQNGGWQPLAQSTRKDRSNKGYSPARPILERTRSLRNSFEMKVSDNKVEVKSDSSYFKYHERGTSKIPQRQMLGIRDEAENYAVSQVIAALTKLFRSWEN